MLSRHQGKAECQPVAVTLGKPDGLINNVAAKLPWYYLTTGQVSEVQRLRRWVERRRHRVSYRPSLVATWCHPWLLPGAIYKREYTNVNNTNVNNKCE